MKLSNRNWKVIYLAATAAVLFGCSKGSKNNGSTPQSSNGLLPLSVGNYWDYSKVDYDSATGLPKDTVADAIDIISEVSVNGTTYYQQNQASITNIGGPSFFVNLDSNTVQKIDSASEYTFFERVTADSSLVDSWADTVKSHCPGHNMLVGFAGTQAINGYDCIRNEVQVADCTGSVFEKWEYYLKPGLGLVRIQLYKLNNTGSYYLGSSEDLTIYHTN